MTTLGLGSCLLKRALGVLAGLALVLALYFALASSYSAVLKTLPVVDVFVLAGLYTARVVAGGIATGYAPSVWLLTFSGFLFLSLALLKRTVELQRKHEPAGSALARRGFDFT